MALVPAEDVWIVVTGFVVSFVLAVALGANDVANSFATSVGSKVLTLRQACILGSIFEVAGAVLLGARVSDTIRKGIIDVTIYNGYPHVLLVGYLAALTGAGIWLLIATIIKLPVSGTHSIVGATVGFALVARGPSSIAWSQMGLIAGSWIISPLFSGIISVLLFLLIRVLVLQKVDKLVAGLKLLPMFYGVTIVVNAFSIFYEGPEQLYLDRIPLWGTLIVAFGLGTIVAIAIRAAFVPWQRRKIIVELEAELNKLGEVALEADTSIPNGVDNDDATNKEHSQTKEIESIDVEVTEKLEVKDSPEVSRLFSKLQVLTAIFGSFAHGGNDVSNAIGPLVAIWLITTEGNVLQEAATPIWVLVYGGFGIVVGLWALGRRVIETMGSDITKVTPSSGFSIEIGSALTVLIASLAGIPISSTHCKVGSVVFVGRVRSKDNVDWKLFASILVAWVVTLPAAGLMSAGVFYGLQYLVPPLGPPWATSVSNISDIINSTAISNITTTLY